MSGLFLTGTDTGVGKTVITGYLAAYLRVAGLRVVTQKWVQTGCDEEPTDLQMHAALGGEPAEEDASSLRCPYRFKFPASPHLAAALEGRAVDPERIRSAYRQLEEQCDLVLVEGVGGVDVPLTEHLLLADLVAELGLPALVVVANRLGCINHSLLTVEALRARGIAVVGLVFDRLSPDGEPEVLRDNPGIVSAFSGVPVLGQMPRLNEIRNGAEEFRPIGDALMERWRPDPAHE